MTKGQLKSGLCFPNGNTEERRGPALVLEKPWHVWGAWDRRVTLSPPPPTRGLRNQPWWLPSVGLKARPTPEGATTKGWTTALSPARPLLEQSCPRAPHHGPVTAGTAQPPRTDPALQAGPGALLGRAGLSRGAWEAPEVRRGRRPEVEAGQSPGAAAEAAAPGPGQGTRAGDTGLASPQALSLLAQSVCCTPRGAA